jgi:hypothetical protein
VQRARGPKISPNFQNKLRYIMSEQALNGKRFPRRIEPTGFVFCLRVFMYKFTKKENQGTSIHAKNQLNHTKGHFTQVPRAVTM